MPASAPRISRKLLEEIERVDDGSLSAADLCRQLGELALRLGLAQPSYQQVRVHLREIRRLRRMKGPSTASVLADVAWRISPPEALIRHLSDRA
jgi:hypothetical protein